MPAPRWPAPADPDAAARLMERFAALNPDTARYAKDALQRMLDLPGKTHRD